MTDTATRLAAADMLDRAREIIEDRGWCQGALTDDAGRVCVVEALDIAKKHGPWCASLTALERAVDSHDIVGFNNAASTTVEDVLLGLKRAAADLREVTA